MVDIARDPRWGRIVEGAGEDPYLGAVDGRGAGARLPGRRPRATRPRCMATAKHFAAYGAAEGGRDYNVADVSRAHAAGGLPPAVRGGGARRRRLAHGVVQRDRRHAGAREPTGCSTTCCAARWGFDGLVVSDWTGVEELLQHGVAADAPRPRRRALDAGVDIEMSSDLYRNDARRPRCAPARFREAAIDSAVRRVLRAKAALGLFDDPVPLQRHGARARGDPHAGAPRRGARPGARVDRAAQERPSAARPRCRSRRTCARSR